MNVQPPPSPDLGRPLVEVRQLDVRFGRQEVLRDIQFTIPRGQTLAVIGESGCGKTVLLKTLASLIRPSRGEVFFDGHCLAKLNDRQLTQQRIRFGFVFQNAALFDSMTIARTWPFRFASTATTANPKCEKWSSCDWLKSACRTPSSQEAGGIVGRNAQASGLARALIMNPT